MGIGPVIGICELPIRKAQEPDLDLPAVFQIQSSAKIGDETYSRSGGNSASGFEGDDTDVEVEFTDPEETSETELSVPVIENGPIRKVSFFA